MCLKWKYDLWGRACRLFYNTIFSLRVKHRSMLLDSWSYAFQISGMKLSYLWDVWTTFLFTCHDFFLMTNIFKFLVQEKWLNNKRTIIFQIFQKIMFIFLHHWTFLKNSICIVSKIICTREKRNTTSSFTFVILNIHYLISMLLFCLFLSLWMT